MMSGYKEEFVKFMVRSDVLTFGDFVTKSGRKTPYFVNTGKFTTSEQIAKLGQFYASCIRENIPTEDYTMMYGPAYKGIPLVVAAAIGLFRDFQTDIPFTFNRKEVKDHGEGGNLIGYTPVSGDKVLIVEDVITAGSSVRESVPILMDAAPDVTVTSLVISVDRMEKGKGAKSAIQEIIEEYGINTYAIVTIKEVVEILHNRPVDGKIYIDDTMKASIEAHLEANAPA